MSGDDFSLSDLTGEEVDHLESYYGPLADSVRDLLDATIRTTAPEAEVWAAKDEIDAVVRRLRASQLPGPAGVHYNSEGRSWAWGNSVVGLRNAMAPPLQTVHEPDGRVHAEATLGAAYEGPPGLVHGGVVALVLDQLMGETASGFKRLTLTGTLTMRYRRGTVLGPVRLEGWIDREEGRKVFVKAQISDVEGVSVEADGVFIIPSWAI